MNEQNKIISLKELLNEASYDAVNEIASLKLGISMDDLADYVNWRSEKPSVSLEQDHVNLGYEQKETYRIVEKSIKKYNESKVPDTITI